MVLRPFWSYYGSRYQLVPSYPRPRHWCIIEPFAGAASYSLHYPERQVLLNDLDPIIAGIWDYLIQVSESEIQGLRNVINHVDELGSVPQEARWLVGFWLARARQRPATKTSSWARDCTQRNDIAGRFWCDSVRRRIASQLQYIRHWKVRCADYQDIPGAGPATYFIDPPFYGVAGRRYRKGSSQIDYAQLGDWCQRRRGQVIVCEQGSADWLPFQRAATGRVMTGTRGTLLWTNQESAPQPGQLSFAGLGG